MKRTPCLLACLAALALTACTYVPQVGMTEKKWLRHTVSYDLVYIQGAVKAYRSSGSYYYFRDGSLVAVNPRLVPADKVTAGI